MVTGRVGKFQELHHDAVYAHTHRLIAKASDVSASLAPAVDIMGQAALNILRSAAELRVVGDHEGT